MNPNCRKRRKEKNISLRLKKRQIIQTSHQVNNLTKQQDKN